MDKPDAVAKRRLVELYIVNEVGALRCLSVAQLRLQFAELFGETTNASNRTWLIKRMIWRMQALAEGETRDRRSLRPQSGLRGLDLSAHALRRRRFHRRKHGSTGSATPPDQRPVRRQSTLQGRNPRRRTTRAALIDADTFGRVQRSCAVIARRFVHPLCNTSAPRSRACCVVGSAATRLRRQLQKPAVRERGGREPGRSSS
jgi:hypothetical protein